MIKYTRQMKQELWELQKRKPHGLKYAIVEYPGTLAIRVYENNIMDFEIDRRVIIMEYLQLVSYTIQSHGVPCHIEGVKGDPPMKVVE